MGVLLLRVSAHLAVVCSERNYRNECLEQLVFLSVAAVVLGTCSKWRTAFVLEEQSSGEFGLYTACKLCAAQERKDIDRIC